MFGAISRGLLLLAALCAVAATEAYGGPMLPMTIHREDVDVSRYPWSAIGKLYNETGSSCSGVLISRDEIVTAAHCLYNYRTRRFIPAASLHFLVGYRTGRYAAHARIASYEIGPGFDPARYDQTSGSDWAVLTVTEDAAGAHRAAAASPRCRAGRHQGHARGLSAGPRLRHDRRPRLRVAREGRRQGGW